MLLRLAAQAGPTVKAGVQVGLSVTRFIASWRSVILRGMRERGATSHALGARGLLRTQRGGLLAPLDDDRLLVRHGRRNHPRSAREWSCMGGLPASLGDLASGALVDGPLRV